MADRLDRSMPSTWFTTQVLGPTRITSSGALAARGFGFLMFLASIAGASVAVGQSTPTDAGLIVMFGAAVVGVVMIGPLLVERLGIRDHGTPEPSTDFELARHAVGTNLIIVARSRRDPDDIAREIRHRLVPAVERILRDQYGTSLHDPAQHDPAQRDKIRQILGPQAYDLVVGSPATDSTLDLQSALDELCDALQQETT